MSTHVKQTHDWMMRHFRRPDETDAQLKALKDDVKKLAEAAKNETENDPERARLIAEYKVAVGNLQDYIAKRGR
jgi:hypothetical protein